MATHHRDCESGVQVVHRDLKPENILITESSVKGQLKITDFGCEEKVYKPKSLVTQCGTPNYVVSEVLNEHPYETKVDVWSVGVILYISLSGYPPFIGDNQRDLFRKIRKGDYKFHKVLEL